MDKLYFLRVVNDRVSLVAKVGTASKLYRHEYEEVQ